MDHTRSSGILLHPTSLPGPYGSGDLGPSAYHFVDWLVVAGQSLWQTLPLGPVGMGDSPYMCLSAFAGEPLLIDLEELVRRGWLLREELDRHPRFDERAVRFGDVRSFRMEKLRSAADAFFGRGSADERSEFDRFCRAQRSWLDDYALFMALIGRSNGAEWCTWDPDLVKRKPAALKKARTELQDDVRFWEFTQWCFFRQWHALKKYANERGVRIVGDIPIFIAYQSSDAWANQHLFHLDKDLRPKFVAGVPPDYFSVTGQRWGNPLYDWKAMHEEQYAWWIDRIRTTLELVDVVRVDHFRGFAGYWEIPAEEKTAVKGRWVKGPGAKLFDVIQKKLGTLPIIAEDLGDITPDVIELRDRYDFPGMRILQFAFAGDVKNGFLPHNYVANTVVYSGTHDNDTTAGWFAAATERERVFVQRYLHTDGREIHWDFIRAASASVAVMAVFPFQDVLGLGTEARMNMPGQALGNWAWRFSWDQVNPTHAQRLYDITAMTNRTAADRLQLPSYPAGKAQP
ncbi:MAG: 4-alpha-glucanotransferase [Bacteroidetes bacterium]|nr:MAG: 4-alpha-glucanotransferase [Bacteroidota bacterium]